MHEFKSLSAIVKNREAFADDINQDQNENTCCNTLKTMISFTSSNISIFVLLCMSRWTFFSHLVSRSQACCYFQDFVSHITNYNFHFTVLFHILVSNAPMSCRMK